MSNMLSYFAVKGFLADISAPPEIRAALDDLMPAVVQHASDQRVILTAEEIDCLLRPEDAASQRRMRKKTKYATKALDTWAQKKPDYS